MRKLKVFVFVSIFMLILVSSALLGSGVTSALAKCVPDVSYQTNI